MNKQNSTIPYTLMTAFGVMAVIAVAAFSTGYAGQVNFNIGPNGINLEIGGPSADQPRVKQY